MKPDAEQYTLYLHRHWALPPSQTCFGVNNMYVIFNPLCPHHWPSLSQPFSFWNFPPPNTYLNKEPTLSQTPFWVHNIHVSNSFYCPISTSLSHVSSGLHLATFCTTSIPTPNWTHLLMYCGWDSTYILNISTVTCKENASHDTYLESDWCAIFVPQHTVEILLSCRK